MPLICISGWKRSGKDTLAEYLINSYGVTQLSFAGPLKDMASEEYGVPRHYFDDQALKEQPLLNLPITPKDAFAATLAQFMLKEFRTRDGGLIDGFIQVGNEWKAFVAPTGIGVYVEAFHTPRSLAILKGSTNRTVDPDFWIKLAFKKADAEFKKYPKQLVVVTDLRYKSEAAQVVNHFGDNATLIRIERFETSPSNDPSERDMDDYPFEHRIQNKTTLQDAYGQLESILRAKKALW